MVSMSAEVARTNEGILWKCCGCPQVLGTVDGAVVTIRHQKRQVKATLPCAQVCDRCGTLNFRPAPEAVSLDSTRTDTPTVLSDTSH
jgi:hypothetical protein